MGEHLEMVRILVRPFVTVGLTLLVGYLVVVGEIDANEIIALYGPVLGFWFGQRTQPPRAVNG